MLQFIIVQILFGNVIIVDMLILNTFNPLTDTYGTCFFLLEMKVKYMALT